MATVELAAFLAGAHLDIMEDVAMKTPFAGNRNVPDPDGAQRRPTHRMVTQTRTNAGRIVPVSPFRCRLWELHDRLQDYVTEESCKADIDRELCNARADDPRPWASATRRSLPAETVSGNSLKQIRSVLT